MTHQQLNPLDKVCNKTIYQRLFLSTIPNYLTIHCQLSNVPLHQYNIAGNVTILGYLHTIELIYRLFIFIYNTFQIIDLINQLLPICVPYVEMPYLSVWTRCFVVIM